MDAACPQKEAIEPNDLFSFVMISKNFWPIVLVAPWFFDKVDLYLTASVGALALQGVVCGDNKNFFESA